MMASGLLATVGKTEAKKRKLKRKKKNKKNVTSPPPPPPGPVTSADASCSGPGESTTQPDPNSRLAQTFTPIASGQLVSAQLRIDKPAGSPGDYTLHLTTVDSSGTPTNNSLAVTSLPNAAVATGLATVTFTFTVQPLVAAGTQYALIVSRQGELRAVGNLQDICAGQAFLSPSPTAPFVPIDGLLDFHFTTFVSA